MLTDSLHWSLGSGAKRGWMLCRPCCVAAAIVVKRDNCRPTRALVGNRNARLPLQLGIPEIGIIRRHVQRYAAPASSTALPDSSPDPSTSQQLPVPEPFRYPGGDPTSPAAASSNNNRSNIPTKRQPSSPPGRAKSQQRVRGSTPAAASAAAQAAADALFTDPGRHPLQAPRIGPVRIAELGGNRGRGLVTTRTVQQGELLMAVRPVALAWDEQCDKQGNGPYASAAKSSSPGADPADVKFLDLQRQLLARRYSPREVAWLSSLAGLPSPEEEEEVGEGEQGEGEERGGVQRQPAAALDTSSSSSSSGGASRPLPPELEEMESGSMGGVEEAEEDKAHQGDQPLPARLRDPDTLADMVQANCFEPDGAAEDEYVFWARREAAEAAAAGAAAEGGDAAAAAAAAASPLASPSPSSSLSPSSLPSVVAAVAEQSPSRQLQRYGRRRQGPVGLWPEAAMLNHSCLPNTVAYVVGDTLFVRAARKVGGGAELTVSYLPLGSGYEGETGALTAGGVGSDNLAAVDSYNDADEDVDDDVTSAPATLLSPVAVRRSALEELRGFVCRCKRCTAEESLDPKLRALMADISEGVAALQRDLQTALAVADLEDNEEEEGEEGEVERGKRSDAASEASRSSSRARDGSGDGDGNGQGPRSGRGQQQQQQREQGRQPIDDDDSAGEDEEGEEEEGGGRWREMVGSVVDRAGLYLELMDAAMVKLKLTPAEQITAQSAVAPLYTVLWAALGARGELEPRLAEVMAALVGEVAPGSVDHIWWAVVARETAEMIVAEEEALEETTVVRRGGAGGSRGGGFSRPQDDRVTIADKACYKAFSIRYGPISKTVFRRLLAARRQREDAQL